MLLDKKYNLLLMKNNDKKKFKNKDLYSNIKMLSNSYFFSKINNFLNAKKLLSYHNIKKNLNLGNMELLQELL
jgi:hypothetical protein